VAIPLTSDEVCCEQRSGEEKYSRSYWWWSPLRHQYIKSQI